MFIYLDFYNWGKGKAKNIEETTIKLAIDLNILINIGFSKRYVRKVKNIFYWNE
jgi:hypothetical protein